MKRISDFVKRDSYRTISLQSSKLCKLTEKRCYDRYKMSIFSLYDYILYEDYSIQRGNDIFYHYDKMINARFNTYTTMSSMRPIDNNFTQVAEACDYKNDVEVTL